MWRARICNSVGSFFLKRGSADIRIVCGDDGSATLNDTASLVAPGSPAPQCGQVTLTPGITLSFDLRFGGTPATAVTHPTSGTSLTTGYNLRNASGTRDARIFFPGGLSFPSAPIAGTAGIPQDFYIGGIVSVPAGTELGIYTGTYEILFTVVP